MNDLPESLNDAILSEPAWLLAWLAVIALTHMLSVGFIAYRENATWRFRWEPLGIVASLMFAGMIMGELYKEFGYVRLLGLGHILGWAPMYAWMLYRRKAIGSTSLWGKYVHLYLLVAGASLVIDVFDTVRYFIGDDASLYLRWS